MAVSSSTFYTTNISASKLIVSGVNSINTIAGTLSAGSTASIDWQNRFLYARNAEVSIDWNDRVLYDTNGGIVLQYKGGENEIRLFGTASVALTASFLPVGTYAITSSWAQSASQALTASFAPNYVLTSRITSGTAAPTGGSDGDIYFQYT